MKLAKTMVKKIKLRYSGHLKDLFIQKKAIILWSIRTEQEEEALKTALDNSQKTLQESKL